MDNDRREASRLTRASRMTIGPMRFRGEAANLAANALLSAIVFAGATAVTAVALGGTAVIILASGVATAMSRRHAGIPTGDDRREALASVKISPAALPRI